MARKNEDDIALVHATYAVTRERQLRDELLAHYDAFAVRLARDFPSWREDRDDLIQVARIGLIHAVDRFDPGRQRPFFAFARATILGELKRHIRDRTWRVRVPRGLQEQYLETVPAIESLTQELRRPPLTGEVAARTGYTEEQVRQALVVSASLAAVSIDHPTVPDAPEHIGAVDPALDGVDNEQTVRRVVALLPEPDQQAIRLRFEEGLTQSAIASRLGVSQMSISRAIARSLRRMQACLSEASA